VATEAIKAKHLNGAKYKVREHNRCALCGRPRGYMRRFDMCRICFRKLASEGKIPGVTKSSW
jgi:small subunit ribosomal protein S14